jgi:hypothetical protein
MDLTGTAFGSAPTWTDYSTHLSTAGDGQPISVSWGRQDSESEIPPSTCSFVLENTSGQWTPGNGAADPDWDVGVPVNIRVTHNAVTYDRFTGYVDSIEPAYPGQSWSKVVVTCSDITARLGRANGLRSLLQLEMLALSPIYFYPMTEAAGSTSTADISGNSHNPAVRYDVPGSPYTLTFGQDMGLFDGGTGVGFGPVNTGNAASTVSICRGGENILPGASGHTQIAWAVMPDAAPASNSPAILNSSDSGPKDVQAVMFINPPDGRAVYMVRNTPGNVTIAYSNANVCDGGLHMVAGVLAADRKTASIFVDGVLQTGSSSAAALNITLTGLTVNEIGGITVPITGSTFPGVISHVAAYGSALTGAQILAVYQAGAGTNTERSDLRFARLATFGGITTSGLPTGQGTMGGQRTAGSPAVDGLHLVGRSEGAPVYATKAGAMTMQARNARYQAAVAATITGVDVNPDLTTRRDRQSLANEITVTNQSGSAQVVKDSTSQTRHGRFDAGSFDVSLSTDDDALQGANWQIATRKNPLPRLPDLTVDLMTGQSVALVAAVLGLDVSSKIQVTGLPSQAPASSFTGFVEGATETIGVQDWSMSFFTSPVTLEDSVLVLDSGTKGILDTNVLGF